MERVVVTCSKQRFALQREAGQLCIRANQGHTMEVGDCWSYGTVYFCVDHPLCVWVIFFLCGSSSFCVGHPLSVWVIFFQCESLVWGVVVVEV